MTGAPGTEHGAVRNRRTWLEQRAAREAEELGHVTRPYVVIVGGVRVASLWARVAPGSAFRPS